jgi:hypothetical protein
MRLIHRINRMMPFFPGLPIAKIKWGRNTCTLRNDLWIVISDGNSSDMLPATMVSEDLLKALGEYMGTYKP